MCIVSVKIYTVQIAMLVCCWNNYSVLFLQKASIAKVA